MPFAELPAGVAVSEKNLFGGGQVRIQTRLIAVNIVGDAVFMRIKPRQKRRPGRTTERRGADGVLNRTPSPASRSRCGVLTTGLPAAP